MGKKKKQVSISWNPLQSTTIGTIKENKYGWIGTIILFILFVAVIFYLPELMDAYNNYMANKTNTTAVTNNTTPDNGTEEPEPPTIEKYTLDQKQSFDFDNFSVKDVKIFASDFSYKVVNTSDNDINLSDLNYFFQFYDESGSVVQAIYLNGKIAKDETKTFNEEITNSSIVTAYSLSIIDEKDFTYFNLDIDPDTNQAVLTCLKDSQSITYTFIDEKLKQIDDTVSYSPEYEDYNEKYDYYQALVDKYNNKKGINISLDTLDEGGLSYNATIDYNSVNNVLDEGFYFGVNTSPRVVKFKAEAMGYTCS